MKCFILLRLHVFIICCFLNKRHHKCPAEPGFVYSECLRRAAVSELRCKGCAVVSQITTTTAGPMEEAGLPAARRADPRPARPLERDRAPTVLTTRTTEPMLLLQAPRPPKRSPPCTKEGSQRFKVGRAPTADQRGGTSPTAPQDRVPITSTVRPTDRGRRASARTRGGRADTRTAPPTPAR